MGISTEVKVGFVFFLGLGLLVVLTIMVGQGELTLRKEGYYIDVLFVDAGGLQKNDTVELAGMEVGKVDSLRIEEDRIRVRLRIDNGVKIRTDARIVIMEKSLLGGRVVSISMGKGPEIVPPGATLTGKKLHGATELIAEMSDIGETFEETLVELEEAIPKLTSPLETMDRVAKRIEKGEGTLGKLLTEEELYEKLISTVETMDKVAKRIEKGEGTLGKLLTEEKLYEEMSETIESARVAADGVAKFTTRIEQVKTYVGIDSAYNENTSQILTKVYLRIEPRPHKLYLVGATALTGPGSEWDEKDEADLQLDLQLGRRFFDNKLTGRIGLFETRVGAGIDYALNNRISLSIEGRDVWTREKDENIDPFLLRSRFQCRIWRGFYLHAGADNILDETAFNFGLRLEYSDEDIKYMLSTLSIGR